MPRVARSAERPSLYNVHPSIKMVQDWIEKLPAETGRSLDEWLRFMKKEGPPSEKERREWLKKEHGLGTNSAWWLAERAEGKGADEDDPESYLKTAVRYVEDMYAGSKAGLRPMHDELLRIGRALGNDVKVCPCQTIVPLYRNHVFAQIKPSTRTRIDFGLALGPLIGKKKSPKRLIDTGGFAKKDRITHRFAITSLDDIDAEVERWLSIAYDLDA